MDPATLASIIAALPGLMKAGTGISQMIKGNQYADTKAPPYEIPSAVYESLNNIKGLASQNQLPGQPRIEENIRSSSADAINSLKELSGSSTDSVLGLGAIAGKEQKAMSNLGIEAANRQDKMKLLVSQALDQLSQQQEKKWQYDKYMPYANAMSAAQRLSNAGNLNVNSGLSDTAGVGAYWAKGRNNNDFTSKINTGIIDNGGTPNDISTLEKYFPGLNLSDILNQATNVNPN